MPRAARFSASVAVLRTKTLVTAVSAMSQNLVDCFCGLQSRTTGPDAEDVNVMGYPAVVVAPKEVP